MNHDLKGLLVQFKWNTIFNFNLLYKLDNDNNIRWCDNTVIKTVINGQIKYMN